MRIETSSQRLAWLIAETIPVGVIGLALAHPLRTLFAKPLAAGIFLTIQRADLRCAELLLRRADHDSPGGGNRSLDALEYREAGVIGLFQSLALLAGISPSGISMVGGLLRGLDHEDAAKFSFLLATPVILAAGVFTLPTLAGLTGDGILGQVLVGAVVAGVAAHGAVRFLTRCFATRALLPFAVYCVLAGLASVVHVA